MRKVILLALVSLAVAGTALAQSEPVRVPPGTATTVVVGTVVSFGGSELVVETPTARQRYVVDSNSSIPMNLSSGTAVSVEFHRLDGGLQHAARVTPTIGADHGVTAGRASGRAAPAGSDARDPKR
jgi:hypothetical protein